MKKLKKKLKNIYEINIDNEEKDEKSKILNNYNIQ